MEFHSSQAFTSYLKSVHARTRRLILVIPPSELEWRPLEGNFSYGDIIRHLASIERYLYAEMARGGENLYSGHGVELANGFEGVLAYYDRLHEEAVTIFSSLSDEALGKKIMSPAGVEITMWKWLRAGLEHEIHHRGQLYLMLALQNIPTPPIFGLTSEEVRQSSKV
ncbi:MAG: DinB family protein [Deinococcales bacterium]